MTEKKLYTCDICHTDYLSKEDATKCEKFHSACLEISDIRYVAHNKYPANIEIEFADGTKHWYRT